MITVCMFSDDVPVCREYNGTDPLPASGWIDLQNPTPEECSLVHEQLNIPLDHLRAALDYNERPRMEYADDALLVVIRTPIKMPNARFDALRTCPIAVIVRDNLAITVSLKKDVVADMARQKTFKGSACSAVQFLLLLFIGVSDEYIRHLRSVDSRLTDIEQTLHTSLQNHELLRLLHLEKALIYFLTALKGNHAVLEKLRNSSHHTVHQEYSDLLDDALIENKQATDMAEIYTQIVGSLGDAFGSIVSNNLNKVMKVLTSLTIVFMIPTIIGAVYGMNVALPLQDKPWAFAALSLICIGLSVAVFRLLRKKDWM